MTDDRASGLVLRAGPPAPDGFPGSAEAGEQLLVADQDGEPVGALLLRADGPALAARELWVRPDRRGRGRGRALLDALREEASARGAPALTLRVPVDDPAAAALVRGRPVLGAYLTRPVGPDLPLPPGAGHRPMTPAELGPWRAALVRAYAQEGLARAGGDPVQARRRAEDDLVRYLPDGLATPDTSVVVLTADSVRVGVLWLRHHRPGGETFGFDLEIEPARRREGHGRAALAVAERLAAAAGDTLLGLHVFGQNAGARALYASAGFQTRVVTVDVLAPG